MNIYTYIYIYAKYTYIYIYMSSGRYLLHQAIGGVFLPRSPVPYGFWRPDLVLHSHIVFACRTYFWLAGWWLAALAGLGWLGWLGWLAAGWVAGWLAGAWLVAGWLAGGLAGWAWLAGWLGWPAAGWLAGWLAVYIIWLWMAGIWWMWAPRFYGHESDLVLTSFWPRTGPRTCTAPESAFVVLVISTKNDEHKVPTSY